MRPLLGALCALLLFPASAKGHRLRIGESRVVTASQFGGPGDPGTGSTGYRGDNLYRHPNSFAELNMGSALGNLPRGARIRVQYKGKSIVVKKRDIGGGGGGLGGKVRAVDLWFQAAKQLGFAGLGNVRVTRLPDKGGAGVEVGVGRKVRPAVTKTVTTAPAVDNSAARQSLQFNYLSQRDNPNALLDLASGLQGAQDTPAQTKQIKLHPPGAGLGTQQMPGGRGGFGGYHFVVGRKHVFTEERTDRGQDFSTNPGGTVNAIGNARVVATSGVFPGKGPVLQLLDGPYKGRYVFYGHMRATLVHKGQVVKAGQPVAVAGGVGGGGPGHAEVGFALDASGRIDPNVGSDHYSRRTGQPFHDLLYKANRRRIGRRAIRSG